MPRYLFTVKAIRTTRRGVSNNFVEEGRMGKVVAHCVVDDTYLIYWPRLKPGYDGDNRTSSHPTKDVERHGSG